jgi:hypothetical protein
VYDAKSGRASLHPQSAYSALARRRLPPEKHVWRARLAEPTQGRTKAPPHTGENTVEVVAAAEAAVVAGVAVGEEVALAALVVTNSSGHLGDGSRVTKQTAPQLGSGLL